MIDGGPRQELGGTTTVQVEMVMSRFLGSVGES